MAGGPDRPGGSYGRGKEGGSCCARARHIALPAAGRAAALARQATREVLAAWRLAHLEETAVLLVSELVTNSVRHARTGGPVQALRLESTGAWLRIEVHDADPRWPQPGTPTGLEESGFGFVLVNALADRWGVCQTATGKAVWAELAS
jgi:serine/threonine-protein kinase RsbW